MELKDLVADLNKDLTLEYAAAVQYIQHFGMVSGAQYMEIRKQLEEHASEEVDHALKLSDMIQYFGGKPVSDVGKVLLSASVPEMLKDNLASENVAIARYRKRIKDAEALGIYELADVIREILGDELDHANDLKLALGR
jgi:bacterioferritin